MIGLGLSPVMVAVQKRFAAAESGTTWDSAHKGAALTLSDGDLTGSAVTDIALTGARSTTSHSSGKRTFRLQWSAGSDTSRAPILGLCTSSFNLADGGSSLDFDDEAWGIYDSGGAAHGAAYDYVETGKSFEPGGYMLCAVDFDAGKIWFGSNDNGFYGDPDAGTGQVFTFTPNTPLFAAMQIGSQGVTPQSITADFDTVNGLSNFLAWNA